MKTGDNAKIIATLKELVPTYKAPEAVNQSVRSPVNQNAGEMLYREKVPENWMAEKREGARIG